MFALLYHRYAQRMLLNREQALTLYQMARLVRCMPGAVAGVGVYRGGSARLMLNAAGLGRTCYLFDDFPGARPVEYSPADRSSSLPEDANHYAEVRALFPESNVQVLSGDLAGAMEDIPDSVRFCFVHVDVSVSGSVEEACRRFYPRLCPGGILLVNGEGSEGESVRESMSAYLADKPEFPISVESGATYLIRLPRRSGLLASGEAAMPDTRGQGIYQGFLAPAE